MSKLNQDTTRKVREVLKEASSIPNPSTHNGPYDDQETKARAFSHQIIIDLYLGNTPREKLEWLLSDEARPNEATFHCRNDSFDKCNGLIGQAWVIEALLAAYRELGKDIYLDDARDVFLCHPFHDVRNLWHRVEIDGSVLSVDETLNHQIWFAAMGAKLSKLSSDNIQTPKRFLDHLCENMYVRDSGLLFHGVSQRLSPYLSFR